MDWIVIGLGVAIFAAGIVAILASMSAEAKARANSKRGTLTEEEKRQLERIKRRRAEMGARDK